MTAKRNTLITVFMCTVCMMAVHAQDSEPLESDSALGDALEMEVGEAQEILRESAAEPTLRREWTLFDETAIWKQIILQTE